MIYLERGKHAACNEHGVLPEGWMHTKKELLQGDGWKRRKGRKNHVPCCLLCTCNTVQHKLYKLMRGTGKRVWSSLQLTLIHSLIHLPVGELLLQAESLILNTEGMWLPLANRNFKEWVQLVPVKESRCFYSSSLTWHAVLISHFALDSALKESV